jgi:osmotically inducible protein OsmC
MKRSASAHWAGNLKEGKGTVSTESGVLAATQYSFGTRFEDGKGTNPEELIAAAHAGCFSMALSGQLANAGLVAEAIDTSATVTFEKLEAGFTVTEVHLKLVARSRGRQDGLRDRGQQRQDRRDLPPPERRSRWRPSSSLTTARPRPHEPSADEADSGHHSRGRMTLRVNDPSWSRRAASIGSPPAEHGDRRVHLELARVHCAFGPHREPGRTIHEVRQGSLMKSGSQSLGRS